MRKLSDKQIVDEAMESVRRSLDTDIPLPPTRSLDQMVNETREKEYQKAKQDKILIATMDENLRNDPEQKQWEHEEGLNRKMVVRDRYEFVIPDSIKIMLYTVLGILCAIFLLNFHL